MHFICQQKNLVLCHRGEYTLYTLANNQPTMSRTQRIHDALSVQLKPETLFIDDESHRHHVPTGMETHFKVVAVSTQFENLSRVARHRMINSLLAPEFTTGLHALSLHLYTPIEWLQQPGGVPASPACRGGKHRA